MNHAIREQLTQMLALFMAEISLLSSKSDMGNWTEERKAVEFARVVDDLIGNLEQYVSRKIEEEVERYYND